MALKKGILIFFLGLFAYLIGGYIVVFKTQQYSIKKTIKNQLKNGVPKGNLFRVVITDNNKNQLKWEENNEFWYKGDIYDIVNIHKLQKDTVVYYCINDKDEKTLFVNLFRLIRQSQKNKQIINDLNHFFELKYLSQRSDRLYLFCFKTNYFEAIIKPLNSPFLKVELPPPVV